MAQKDNIVIVPQASQIGTRDNVPISSTRNIDNIRVPVQPTREEGAVTGESDVKYRQLNQAALKQLKPFEVRLAYGTGVIPPSELGQYDVSAVWDAERHQWKVTVDVPVYGTDAGTGVGGGGSGPSDWYQNVVWRDNKEWDKYIPVDLTQGSGQGWVKVGTGEVAVWDYDKNQWKVIPIYNPVIGYGINSRGKAAFTGWSGPQNSLQKILSDKISDIVRSYGKKEDIIQLLNSYGYDSNDPKLKEWIVGISVFGTGGDALHPRHRVDAKLLEDLMSKLPELKKLEIIPNYVTNPEWDKYKPEVSYKFDEFINKSLAEGKSKSDIEKTLTDAGYNGKPIYRQYEVLKPMEQFKTGNGYNIQNYLSTMWANNKPKEEILSTVNNLKEVGFDISETQKYADALIKSEEDFKAMLRDPKSDTFAFKQNLANVIAKATLRDGTLYGTDRYIREISSGFISPKDYLVKKDMPTINFGDDVAGKGYVPTSISGDEKIEWDYDVKAWKVTDVNGKLIRYDGIVDGFSWQNPRHEWDKYKPTADLISNAAWNKNVDMVKAIGEISAFQGGWDWIGNQKFTPEQKKIIAGYMDVLHGSAPYSMNNAQMGFAGGFDLDSDEFGNITQRGQELLKILGMGPMEFYNAVHYQIYSVGSMGGGGGGGGPNTAGDVVSLTPAQSAVMSVPAAGAYASSASSAATDAAYKALPGSPLSPSQIAAGYTGRDSSGDAVKITAPKDSLGEQGLDGTYADPYNKGQRVVKIGEPDSNGRVTIAPVNYIQAQESITPTLFQDALRKVAESKAEAIANGKKASEAVIGNVAQALANMGYTKAAGQVGGVLEDGNWSLPTSAEKATAVMAFINKNTAQRYKNNDINQGVEYIKWGQDPITKEWGFQKNYIGMGMPSVGVLFVPSMVIGADREYTIIDPDLLTEGKKSPLFNTPITLHQLSVAVAERKVGTPMTSQEKADFIKKDMPRAKLSCQALQKELKDEPVLKAASEKIIVNATDDDDVVDYRWAEDRLKGLALEALNINVGSDYTYLTNDGKVATVAIKDLATAKEWLAKIANSYSSIGAKVADITDYSSIQSLYADVKKQFDAIMADSKLVPNEYQVQFMKVVEDNRKGADVNWKAVTAWATKAVEDNRTGASPLAGAPASIRGDIGERIVPPALPTAPASKDVDVTAPTETLAQKEANKKIAPKGKIEAVKLGTEPVPSVDESNYLAVLSNQVVNMTSDQIVERLALAKENNDKGVATATDWVWLKAFNANIPDDRKNLNIMGIKSQVSRNIGEILKKLSYDTSREVVSPNALIPNVTAELMEKSKDEVMPWVNDSIQAIELVLDKETGTYDSSKITPWQQFVKTQLGLHTGNDGKVNWYGLQIVLQRQIDMGVSGEKVPAGTPKPDAPKTVTPTTPLPMTDAQEMAMATYMESGGIVRVNDVTGKTEHLVDGKWSEIGAAEVGRVEIGGGVPSAKGALPPTPAKPAEFVGVYGDNTTIKLPNALNNPAVNVFGVSQDGKKLGFSYGGYDWVLEPAGGTKLAYCTGGTCIGTKYSSYDDLAKAIIDGTIKHPEGGTDLSREQSITGAQLLTIKVATTAGSGGDGLSSPTAKLAATTSNNDVINLPPSFKNPDLTVRSISKDGSAVGFEFAGHNWIVSKGEEGGKTYFGVKYGDYTHDRKYDTLDEAVSAVTQGEIEAVGFHPDLSWSEINKSYEMLPASSNILKTTDLPVGYGFLRNLLLADDRTSISRTGGTGVEVDSPQEPGTHPLTTAIAYLLAQDSSGVAKETLFPSWFDPAKDTLKPEVFPEGLRPFVRALNRTNANVYGVKAMLDGRAAIAWLPSFLMFLKDEDLTDASNNLKQKLETPEYDLISIMADPSIPQSVKKSLQPVDVVVTDSSIEKILTDNNIDVNKYYKREKDGSIPSSRKLDWAQILDDPFIPQKVKDSLYIKSAFASDALQGSMRVTDAEAEKILTANGIFNLERYKKTDATKFIEWLNRNVNPQVLLPFSSWGTPTDLYTIEGVVDGKYVKAGVTVLDAVMLVLGPVALSSLWKNTVMRGSAALSGGELKFAVEQGKHVSLELIKLLFTQACAGGACFSGTAGVLGWLAPLLAGGAGKVGGGKKEVEMGKYAPVDSGNVKEMAYRNLYVAPQGKYYTAASGQVDADIRDKRGITIVQTTAKGCAACDLLKSALVKYLESKGREVNYIVLNMSDADTKSLANKLANEGALFGDLNITPQLQVYVDGKPLSLEGYFGDYKEGAVEKALDDIIAKYDAGFYKKGSLESKPTGSVPPISTRDFTGFTTITPAPLPVTVRTVISGMVMGKKYGIEDRTEGSAWDVYIKTYNPSQEVIDKLKASGIKIAYNPIVTASSPITGAAQYRADENTLYIDDRGDVTIDSLANTIAHEIAHAALESMPQSQKDVYLATLTEYNRTSSSPIDLSNKKVVAEVFGMIITGVPIQGFLPITAKQLAEMRAFVDKGEGAAAQLKTILQPYLRQGEFQGTQEIDILAPTSSGDVTTDVAVIYQGILDRQKFGTAGDLTQWEKLVLETYNTNTVGGKLDEFGNKVGGKPEYSVITSTLNKVIEDVKAGRVTIEGVPNELKARTESETIVAVDSGIGYPKPTDEWKWTGFTAPASGAGDDTPIQAKLKRDFDGKGEGLHYQVRIRGNDGNWGTYEYYLVRKSGETDRLSPIPSVVWVKSPGGVWESRDPSKLSALSTDEYNAESAGYNLAKSYLEGKNGWPNAFDSPVEIYSKLGGFVFSKYDTTSHIDGYQATPYKLLDQAAKNKGITFVQYGFNGCDGCDKQTGTLNNLMGDGGRYGFNNPELNYYYIDIYSPQGDALTASGKYKASVYPYTVVFIDGVEQPMPYTGEMSELTILSLINSAKVQKYDGEGSKGEFLGKVTPPSGGGSTSQGVGFSPDSVKYTPSTLVDGPIEALDGVYFVSHDKIDMGPLAPLREVTHQYFVSRDSKGGVGKIYWREPGQQWRDNQYKWIAPGVIEKGVCEGEGCTTRELVLNTAVKYVLTNNWSTVAPPPASPADKVPAPRNQEVITVVKPVELNKPDIKLLYSNKDNSSYGIETGGFKYVIHKDPQNKWQVCSGMGCSSTEDYKTLELAATKGVADFNPIAMYDNKVKYYMDGMNLSQEEARKLSGEAKDLDWDDNTFSTYKLNPNPVIVTDPVVAPTPPVPVAPPATPPDVRTAIARTLSPKIQLITKGDKWDILAPQKVFTQKELTALKGVTDFTEANIEAVVGTEAVNFAKSNSLNLKTLARAALANPVFNNTRIYEVGYKILAPKPSADDINRPLDPTSNSQDIWRYYYQTYNIPIEAQQKAYEAGLGITVAREGQPILGQSGDTIIQDAFVLANPEFIKNNMKNLGHEFSHWYLESLPDADKTAIIQYFANNPQYYDKMKRELVRSYGDNASSMVVTEGFAAGFLPNTSEYGLTIADTDKIASDLKQYMPYYEGAKSAKEPKIVPYTMEAYAKMYPADSSAQGGGLLTTLIPNASAYLSKSLEKQKILSPAAETAGVTIKELEEANRKAKEQYYAKMLADANIEMQTSQEEDAQERALHTPEKIMARYTDKGVTNVVGALKDGIPTSYLIDQGFDATYVNSADKFVKQAGKYVYEDGTIDLRAAIKSNAVGESLLKEMGYPQESINHAYQLAQMSDQSYIEQVNQGRQDKLIYVGTEDNGALISIPESSYETLPDAQKQAIKDGGLGGWKAALAKWDATFDKYGLKSGDRYDVNGAILLSFGADLPVDQPGRIPSMAAGGTIPTGIQEIKANSVEINTALQGLFGKEKLVELKNKVAEGQKVPPEKWGDYINTVWQAMTPWEEQMGQVATPALAGTMAAGLLVPYFSLLTEWGALTPSQRISYAGLDTASLIPVFGGGIRAAATARRAGMSAGRALGRVALAEVTSPYYMVRHPLQTLKAPLYLVQEVIRPLQVSPEGIIQSLYNKLGSYGKDIKLLVGAGAEVGGATQETMRILVEGALRGDAEAMQGLRLIKESNTGMADILNRSGHLPISAHANPAIEKFVTDDNINNGYIDIKAPNRTEPGMFFTPSDLSHFYMQAAHGGQGQILGGIWHETKLFTDIPDDVLALRDPNKIWKELLDRQSKGLLPNMVSVPKQYKQWIEQELIKFEHPSEGKMYFVKSDKPLTLKWRDPDKQILKLANDYYEEAIDKIKIANDLSKSGGSELAIKQATEESNKAYAKFEELYQNAVKAGTPVEKVVYWDVVKFRDQLSGKEGIILHTTSEAELPIVKPFSKDLTSLAQIKAKGWMNIGRDLFKPGIYVKSMSKEEQIARIRATLNPDEKKRFDAGIKLSELTRKYKIDTSQITSAGVPTVGIVEAVPRAAVKEIDDYIKANSKDFLFMGSFADAWQNPRFVSEVRIPGDLDVMAIDPQKHIYELHKIIKKYDPNAILDVQKLPNGMELHRIQVNKNGVPEVLFELHDHDKYNIDQWYKGLVPSDDTVMVGGFQLTPLQTEIDAKLNSLLMPGFGVYDPHEGLDLLPIAGGRGGKGYVGPAAAGKPQRLKDLPTLESNIKYLAERLDSMGKTVEAKELMETLDTFRGWKREDIATLTDAIADAINRDAVYINDMYAKISAGQLSRKEIKDFIVGTTKRSGGDTVAKYEKEVERVVDSLDMQFGEPAQKALRGEYNDDEYRAFIESWNKKVLSKDITKGEIEEYLQRYKQDYQKNFDDLANRVRREEERQLMELRYTRLAESMPLQRASIAFSNAVSVLPRLAKYTNQPVYEPNYIATATARTETTPDRVSSYIDKGSRFTGVPRKDTSTERVTGRVDTTIRTGGTPRMDTPPRTDTPPRIDVPPRTDIPPRLDTPPRLSTPPRITVPPRISLPPTITTMIEGGSIKKQQRNWGDLTREEKAAAIVWKQGFWHWALPKPYSQKDLIGSSKPFAGTKVHHGPKAAYKSVAKVQGAELPDRIDIDLGIMDLTFMRDKDGKDVKVFYRADPKQKTTGKGPSNMPETLTHRTSRTTQVSSVG